MDSREPKRPLMPRPPGARRPVAQKPRLRARKKESRVRTWLPAAGSAFAIALALFSLPTVLANDLANETSIESARAFPISVDPERKLIVEDPAIEELLSVEPTTLTAALGVAEGLYRWLAVSISETPWYQQIAGAAGVKNLFVVVYPGQRSEEVAAAFGAKLGWSAAERAAFLKETRALDPELAEGKFVPGTYFVGVTEPDQVAAITHERFESEILARYGTSTAARVPLEDALIIASLIEREAAGWEDMRLISGIIWNRLFIGMNLQIDATMQYSKASLAGGKGKGGWWPVPVPADKNIRHPYNTYRRSGLPPGPIANSSIAAVVAALNPKKTDCIFYFHDQYGRFHCSPTYEGHVALLKKHYGQGR